MPLLEYGYDEGRGGTWTEYVYDAELPVVKGRVFVEREDHTDQLRARGFLLVEEEVVSEDETTKRGPGRPPKNEIKKATLNQ